MIVANRMMSPPAPQPKQRQIPRFKSQENDGERF
jgi:hypothetical protein